MQQWCRPASTVCSASISQSAAGDDGPQENTATGSKHQSQAGSLLVLAAMFVAWYGSNILFNVSSRLTDGNK